MQSASIRHLEDMEIRPDTPIKIAKDDGEPRKPTEDDEPLLKENKDRFVLFPIKYKSLWEMVCLSGLFQIFSTKNTKRVSGLLKKLIFRTTRKIGTL
jgi:hypothetical protein